VSPSSRKTNEVDSRTSRLSRVLMVAIAAMAASSCTIHHTITFDELSKDMRRAAEDVRAAQTVESDLRYGSEGRWAVIVVGRDGFDAAAAVDDGLAEGDAARVADLLKSLSGTQYLVGITPHSVSHAGIPDATCDLGGQRVVVANDEGWIGFTVERRHDAAPALTDFRLLDGPRQP
jgi:hypothetical protein